jgi:uncharacterized oligopeptide transporter (OPT) family protein
MGIGAGILLVAVGAVLTFAVHVTTNGFNLHSIGVILMIAGAVGVLLDVVMFMPRRRRVVTTTTPYPPAGEPVAHTTIDDRY